MRAAHRRTTGNRSSLCLECAFAFRKQTGSAAPLHSDEEVEMTVEIKFAPEESSDACKFSRQVSPPGV